MSSVWYPGKEEEIELKNQELQKIAEALEQDARARDTAELIEGRPPEKGQISFINKDEEAEARKFIEEEFLCNHAPRVTGIYMAVMIYDGGNYHISREGERTDIYMPDSVRNRKRFENPVGRVVLQGLACYKGKDFQENLLMRGVRKVFGKWMSPTYKQPWCKVGEWIMYPRTEGLYVNFKGKPMQIIRDDTVVMVLQNPTDVNRDF